MDRNDDMPLGDRARSSSAVAALLGRNREIAGSPSLVTIERKSRNWNEQGIVVRGVKVTPVARSTAHDLLRQKTRRVSREFAESFWAVLYRIADQDPELDTATMHSLRELRACFAQARTADADTPPGLMHRSAPGDDDDPESSLWTGLGLRKVDSPGQHDRVYQATVRMLIRAHLADAWWRDHEDAMPAGFGAYLTLEREASGIRTHAPDHIPGLLQTEDYARHSIRQNFPGLDEPTRERRVELQMMRRQVLRRSDPPAYWAIIGPRALRDRTVPAQVMRRQVEHLLTMANFTNVRVQLVTDPDADRLLPSATTIMRFYEQGYSDLVYQEHDDFGTYHVNGAEVADFQLRYSRLLIKALRPEQTLRTLLEMRARFRS
ncbi:hypothetical protein J4573_04520 [Actinomadura barringtoniae]|uniref:DUF5753 domain-containing protein n=1 Tax=Actinomadura barringtoniae TaxID=1427535 RepID=A0A939P784_9ACTN|nr:DUF5753 domain-containing protein [Actinomadura barringtoniae]MBO2446342.1 hypothetical protein [Actinomadura barringtoniae]